MANERTCMICGTEYKYCSHCREYDSTKMWMYLYHDEKCKAIGETLYAYRGKEITKEEAREAMLKCTPNIDDAIKYPSLVASEIRNILDVSNEEKVEEVVNKNKPVEKPVVDETSEDKPVKENNPKYSKYNKKK